jgi:ribosomal protein L40E
VSTKICPNCNAEVPGVANLCKHCFHDFNVVVPKKKSPLFTLLFLAVGTAIVSAGAYGYIYSQNKTYKISVDQETKSIVFTTKYADHVETDRVMFKDVASVEYVKNAEPRPFEVAVVTARGDRYVYQQGDDPLDYQARQLATLMDKPLAEKDNYEAPTVLKKQ